MTRRPDSGVWAGMWELPRGTVEAGQMPEACLARIVRETLGIPIAVGELAVEVKHTVMRQAITLRAYHAEALAAVVEGETLRWVSEADRKKLPMAAPQKRAIARLDAL
jgi:adenine-specific DNA glycosylase